jgi:hypothetical protein
VRVTVFHFDDPYNLYFRRVLDTPATGNIFDPFQTTRMPKHHDHQPSVEYLTMHSCHREVVHSPPPTPPASGGTGHESRPHTDSLQPGLLQFPEDDTPELVAIFELMAADDPNSRLTTGEALDLVRTHKKILTRARLALPVPKSQQPHLNYTERWRARPRRRKRKLRRRRL